MIYNNADWSVIFKLRNKDGSALPLNGATLQLSILKKSNRDVNAIPDLVFLDSDTGVTLSGDAQGDVTWTVDKSVIEDLDPTYYIFELHNVISVDSKKRLLGGEINVKRGVAP